MKTRFLFHLALCLSFPMVAPVRAEETNKVGRSDAPATAQVLDNQQKLGPGDRVTYRVLEDQDEPKSLVVTDSGHLDVPYYGLVPAAGKSSRELAGEIKALLEEQLYHEATVVLAIELADRTRVAGKVYVTGQVRSPGGYEIPAGESFTVSKAILSAGGFSDFSDKRAVKLVRNGPDGKKLLVVNVQDIWKKGELEKDLEVKPDDLIVVPARLLNY